MSEGIENPETKEPVTEAEDEQFSWLTRLLANALNLDHDGASHVQIWVDNLKTVAYALCIALFIRIFLYQPFNIPSGSMIPTLLVGDYLFVAKYEYGLSRHSFPFSPHIFEGRIMGSEPERGDVAVFKLPSDGRTDYIKRIIGLPGDRVQIRDGVLYINDKEVKRERLEDYVTKDRFGNAVTVRQFRETLPNGVTYVTHDLIDRGRADNTTTFVVPAGYFFAMGDNRDNSTDSRFPTVGYIPFENFVGKAEVIFFSTDGSSQLWKIWKWFSATRWERIFTGL